MRYIKVFELKNWGQLSMEEHQMWAELSLVRLEKRKPKTHYKHLELIG